jgi:hypothetical protein
MANLKISQLPITKYVEVSDPLASVHSGVTSQITKNDFLVNLNNFTGNTDTLDGSVIRNLYSRSNVITSTLGVNSDLMSGTTQYGSRNFPTSFFTNSVDYKNKIVHFRLTGVWGSADNTPAVDFKLYFGNDLLFSGSATGAQANNHPVEIMGEISFVTGFAIPCVSIGWCENNGTFLRYALSNPSVPINVSSFTGGDLKLILGSTTSNTITTYLGYIQIFN